MNLRAINPDDIENIKKIHDEHFSHEFSFEEFRYQYLNAFLVEDDNGIISAGGIRNICEAVIVTDKSRTVRDRKDALLCMLHASISTIDKIGYNQLHAFVQDETFMRHLILAGFKETKGKALVLEIDNGQR